MTFLLVAFSLMVSCERGAVSSEPPIHVNPNMDSQNKYKAQNESGYFADGMVNRMPIEGVVATSEAFENSEYYFAKTQDGKLIEKAPIPFTSEVLARGQDRYSIYCTPCHGGVGNGKGIIINRGFLPPPDFHQDKYRDYTDGQIFDIITNGFRNMPSYKHQIPVEDRWAIVGFVRALQRSQNAQIEDVPLDMRDKLVRK